MDPSMMRVSEAIAYVWLRSLASTQTPKPAIALDLHLFTFFFLVSKLTVQLACCQLVASPRAQPRETQLNSERHLRVSQPTSVRIL